MPAPDRPTSYRYWIALTITALALRLAVAIVLIGVSKGPAQRTGDAFAYADQAHDMVAGEWTYPNFWPAGRSFALVPFFWAFGTSEATVRANSIAFDIACVLMAAVLGHQILRRRSAARLSGWIAACYPPMVLLASKSYSMNVAMFFLLLFASLTIAACRSYGKSLWQTLALWLLAGGALGFACITRPSAQSIWALGLAGGVVILLLHQWRPQVFSAAVWPYVSWKNGMLAGAAAMLGVFLSELPCLGHNYSLNAGWVLSVNNEWNCLLGNNPYTPYYKTWHLGETRGASTPEIQAYLAKFKGKDVPRSAMVQEAIRYVKERPDIFALRTANRIRAYWGFDYLGSSVLMQTNKPLGALFLLLEASGYCLLMLLVFGSLFMVFGKMSADSSGMAARYAWFLIAMVLAYQFPYALTHAGGSYRFAIMGMLFPLAGLALDEACLGKRGGWPALLRRKGFWIVLGMFSLVQLEYAYWVLAYH
jgi:hypothetical protein